MIIANHSDAGKRITVSTRNVPHDYMDDYRLFIFRRVVKHKSKWIEHCSRMRDERAYHFVAR